MSAGREARGAERDESAGREAWGAERDEHAEDSEIQDSRASRLAPRASHLAPRASSTGLDPRTAAALAYLAGPFSGALILFAETSNDDVRFHAWQSLVGLGGLTLAVLASYALGIVAIFISATAVSVMFGAATVLWIVLLIVWAICLWKAAIGERWHLPLAGPRAERFARRRAAIGD